MSSLYLKEISSGKTYELKKEIMKLGRSQDSEIPLLSPSISRHHATLYIQDGQLIIEDAGSQNGVRINKKRIAAATSLKIGDRIEVGGVELDVFDPDRPAPERPSIATPPPPRGPDPFQSYAKSERSASKEDEGSGRKRLLIYGGAALLLVAFFLIPDDSAKRDPASNLQNPPTEEELTNALNSESYTKGNYIPKSPTEVEAESRFRQAMRDYYDGNYSRSLVVLKQALVANPSHEGAREYVQFAEQRLNKQIDDLMKSGQRSYSVLQYARARSEFSQVLSILSEQIPGYWQRISSDLNNASVNDRRPAQEEVLLKIPCEKTKRKNDCKISVDMIRLCRKLLGEEDVLK